MIALEVCVCADDVTTLAQQLHGVKQGGAQRVELCADMAQEGLTPSVQAVEIAREVLADKLELLVMIRPRGGDFCYQPAELSCMLRDIELAARTGADGVVLGCVNAQLQLDFPALTPLLKAAKDAGLKVTFHRAFDLLANPQQGLAQLITLGVERVLSSGTLWQSGLGAEHGLRQLNTYLQLAQTQIEVVVGGGVALNNLAQLLSALPLPPGTVRPVLSFHCYSSLLTHNRVDVNKVRQAISILASKSTVS